MSSEPGCHHPSGRRLSQAVTVIQPAAAVIDLNFFCHQPTPAGLVGLLQYFPNTLQNVKHQSRTFPSCKPKSSPPKRLRTTEVVAQPGNGGLGSERTCKYSMSPAKLPHELAQ